MSFETMERKNFIPSKGEGGPRFSFMGFEPRHPLSADGSYGVEMTTVEITDPNIPAEVLDFIYDWEDRPGIQGAWESWLLGRASDEQKDFLESSYRQWLMEHPGLPKAA